MDKKIEIENCDLIQVITKITIHVLNIVLNDRATIQVLCYDDGGKVLNSYIFELIEEYHLWRDDNFLIQYVCEKYGFVLKNNSPEI